MGFVENAVEDKIYMMNSNIFSERPVGRKSLLESSIHKVWKEMSMQITKTNIKTKSFMTLLTEVF